VLDGIECTECGNVLNETYRAQSGKPCPRCGSIKRTIHVSVIASVMPQIHEQVAWRSGNRRRGKPLRWGVVGDDLYRKLGRWSTLERIFDRIKDYYYEHIADKETGAVIKHCEEKLSEHRGRGLPKKPEKGRR
jgi:phage FluMu protein Com